MAKRWTLYCALCSEIKINLPDALEEVFACRCGALTHWNLQKRKPELVGSTVKQLPE